MRTTVDIPDELLKHLKARAALEGRTLRDLVVDLVEKGLNARGAADPQLRFLARPVFGTGPAGPAMLQLMDPVRRDELLHEDDDERARQLMAGR
jgi:hypothetical protein